MLHLENMRSSPGIPTRNYRRLPTRWSKWNSQPPYGLASLKQAHRVLGKPKNFVRSFLNLFDPIRLICICKSPLSWLSPLSLQTNTKNVASKCNTQASLNECIVGSKPEDTQKSTTPVPPSKNLTDVRSISNSAGGERGVAGGAGGDEGGERGVAAGGGASEGGKSGVAAGPAPARSEGGERLCLRLRASHGEYTDHCQARICRYRLKIPVVVSAHSAFNEDT